MVITPERGVIDARQDPVFNPSIALLRKTLAAGKDAEDGFRAWRKHPYTRAFVNALAEMVDTPPVHVNGEDSDPNKILVQYGITTGLSLAFKLLTQPNRIFPEVFRGSDAGKRDDNPLDTAYVDTQDSVIDNM